MSSFLVALSKMCEQRGSPVVVAGLCSGVNSDPREIGPVVRAAKTFLNVLNTPLSVSAGVPQLTAAADAGGLPRLELRLLEVLVRVESDVHGNVRYACHHIRRIQRPQETIRAHTLCAVERRRWMKRTRRLTTVTYPHLSGGPYEDEEAFKRVLRSLYGGEQVFGPTNKLRYDLTVALPFSLNNSPHQFRRIIEKKLQLKATRHVRHLTPSPK
ncbi:hypothetical protein TraAM80_10448 [Trypanosoma rangeli]|uniref:Uncharacterized protein n=1 Tax=Trypanosoma rangeli TaxID=5698 RepID=A0A3R7JT32_TRYRA|nr:uncharacterized protein TraAM80_10448 [Trypanosoma rangeli]RNE95012.1 hypothetical protein TraAM80_10448 [Trypanosoma rangeli]|eukprot:RNE95012.1 hypothetical protein TraAM80_10448 [Trypanosoma rangeli]